MLYDNTPNTHTHTHTARLLEVCLYGNTPNTHTYTHTARLLGKGQGLARERQGGSQRHGRLVSAGDRVPQRVLAAYCQAVHVPRQPQVHSLMDFVFTRTHACVGMLIADGSLPADRYLFVNTLSGPQICTRNIGVSINAQKECRYAMCAGP